VEQRPKVVSAFYKNGHNYQRDYGVEVHTLGNQIMRWWAVICPPVGVPSIRFAGPTGVCTLVVLMSWWCTRLKAKSNRECADCLRTLKDIDRVLLTAIGDIKNRPTASTLPQPRKRVNSERLAPRKRRRPGNV